MNSTFLGIFSNYLYDKNKLPYHDTSLKQCYIEAINQYYPLFPWKSFHEAAKADGFIKELDDAKILKGGFSSDALFKIHLGSRNYVLRFIGKEHPANQRKIMSQSFEWAGANGFGSKVHLIDRKLFSFIVYDFIEGRTLTLEDTKNKKILQLIGKTLSKVHRAPIPKENHQNFSQFTVGQAWYKSVMTEKGKSFGPSVLKEAYKHWIKINDDINNQPVIKTMLHNDPNLRNILLHNDEITLIDWELAGIEDPRKEIAHVCAWYGLDDELTKIFLTAYYNREPTNKELLLLKKIKTLITLEFAWIGLSTLKTNFNQKTWDAYYKKAPPKTIEDLSIIQINSKNKPSDEITMELFLGLIKQFMKEVKKDN